MKKSSSFLSLILSTFIVFSLVFTFFSCNSGANRAESTPTWAIGDWVANNKKVFTLHSDGQTVYNIAGLSALKLEWNEPVTIDGDTYTAIIRRNENDIFETQLKTTKENSSIPLYLYTKITKTDDDNYSYSTFAPLYGLDVEPIYANSAKATKDIDDIIIPVESIELDYTEYILSLPYNYSTIGADPLQLTATITPSDATDQNIIWTSSDPDVAGVDENGFVVPFDKEGETTITARVGDDKTATCIIKVELPGSTYFRASLSVNVNETSVSHKTEGIGGKVVGIDDIVKWISFDPSVATVDESGEVLGVSEGYARMAAVASSGKVVPFFYTVLPAIIYADSVKLTQDSISLAVNESFDLNNLIESVSPENYTGELYWESEDSDILKITWNRRAKAINEGEVVVRLKSKSCDEYATCTVRVVFIPVDSISINSSVKVNIGEPLHLAVKLSPDNASDKKVTWESLDPSIATVESTSDSEQCIVYGNSQGLTKIIAKSHNDLVAECEVVVVRGVSYITLPETATLKIGETLGLSATIYPSDATDKTISWASESPEIATVDENGNVEAKAVGEAIIIAKSVSSGVSDKCKITVKPILVESITLSKTNATLKVGDILTLNITISPENATDKSITWRSSDTSVATVNASGIITAIAPGTVTITAKSENYKTATCNLTINPKTIPVTAISMLTDKTLYVGDTFQMNATITPANATDKSITWSSSAPAVASVNASGIVTAKSAGTATITAKSSNSKTATCALTINSKTIQPTSIQISQSSMTMRRGEGGSLVSMRAVKNGTAKSYYLTASVLPANATDRSITWKTSDSSVASIKVSGDKCYITAKKIGTATITAMASNGKSASCKIEVKPPLPKRIEFYDSSGFNNEPTRLRRIYPYDIEYPGKKNIEYSGANIEYRKTVLYVWMRVYPYDADISGIESKSSYPDVAWYECYNGQNKNSDIHDYTFIRTDNDGEKYATICIVIKRSDDKKKSGWAILTFGIKDSEGNITWVDDDDSELSVGAVKKRVKWI